MRLVARTQASAARPANAARRLRWRLRGRGKSRPRLGAVKQIKPLLGDQPERRMPRCAAPRAIAIGSWPRSAACRRRERRRMPSGCLRCRTPDRAAEAKFHSARPALRRGIDEVGDRVEAIDGQPGVAVDDHPFGRGGADRSRGEAAGPDRRNGQCTGKVAEKAPQRTGFRSCRAAVIFRTCGALIEFPAVERYGSRMSNGLSGAVPHP